MFFFDVGADPFFKKIEEMAEDGVVKTYADDGAVAVHHDKGTKILQFIIDQGPQWGFHLKPSKTTILLGVCQSSEEANTRLQNYLSILKPPPVPLCQSCQSGNPCPMASHCGKCRAEIENMRVIIHPKNISDDILRTAHERVYGVRLLGSPIGTEQYQLTFCSKILEKIQTAAERVQNFPDSQTQWTFLNKVLKGKKIIHSERYQHTLRTTLANLSTR